MRTRNLFGIVSLFLCAVALSGCKDDKAEDETSYPLIFEKNYYEVRYDVGTTLQPISCNDYGLLELKVGDTDILDARTVIIENGSTHSSGYIELKGLQKGETVLNVMDRKTKESADLTVKVVDNYLEFKLRDTNHPLFQKEGVKFLFLIDNEEKDCYLFGEKSGSMLPHNQLAKGTYSFSVENNVPYLTLTVTDGENNITPYKFNLLNNSHTTYAVLNKYYHLNWSVETGRSASLDNTVYMLMTEDATGYEVAFAITSTAEIPDNILK